MQILITGNSVFVGSHPSKKPVGEGRNVICLDGVRTGDQYNIEHLFINPKFESVEHHVTSPRCVTVGRIYNLVNLPNWRFLVSVQKDR